jgi:hypothetical protein
MTLHPFPFEFRYTCGNPPPPPPQFLYQCDLCECGASLLSEHYCTDRQCDHVNQQLQIKDDMSSTTLLMLFVRKTRYDGPASQRSIASDK